MPLFAVSVDSVEHQVDQAVRVGEELLGEGARREKLARVDDDQEDRSRQCESALRDPNSLTPLDTDAWLLSMSCQAISNFFWASTPFMVAFAVSLVQPLDSVRPAPSS